MIKEMFLAAMFVLAVSTAIAALTGCSIEGRIGYQGRTGMDHTEISPEFVENATASKVNRKY